MRTALLAPYITAWTEEEAAPADVVERPGGGIAYRGETLADRDGHGVLWARTPYQPGQGRPDFGKVHPIRQRRAMQRLLCQVCAQPADQTEDGVLWLFRDHREDWPSWPDGMGITEPPICIPCARLSVKACPALRRGAVVVRAGSFTTAGVYGTLYRAGREPVATTAGTVVFNDPAIRWILAVNLVRELRDCVIIPLTELTGKQLFETARS